MTWSAENRRSRSSGGLPEVYTSGGGSRRERCRQDHLPQSHPSAGPRLRSARQRAPGAPSLQARFKS
eukprot:4602566-Pyramimonas_sp.AAC.1